MQHLFHMTRNKSISKSRAYGLLVFFIERLTDPRHSGCCKLVNGYHLNIIVAVPLGSSTLCLLLITVERYLSVVYPFHHQHIFTKARRYTLVFISWALAILIMGIVPFLIRKDEHPIIYKVCLMKCELLV